MLAKHVLLKDIFLDYMIPHTKEYMKLGGHIMGAAIIKPRIYHNNAAIQQADILAVGTDKKHINPIQHSVIDVINTFYEIDSENNYDKFTLITSHQPCLMCTFALSSLSKLTQVYYLFDYTETQNMFNIAYPRSDWFIKVAKDREFTNYLNITSDRKIQYKKLEIDPLVKTQLTIEYLNMSMQVV